MSKVPPKTKLCVLSCAFNILTCSFIPRRLKIQCFIYLSRSQIKKLYSLTSKREIQRNTLQHQYILKSATSTLTRMLTTVGLNFSLVRNIWFMPILLDMSAYHAMVGSILMLINSSLQV